MLPCLSLVVEVGILARSMRILKTEKRIVSAEGESREFRGATKNYTETYRPKVFLEKVSGAS